MNNSNTYFRIVLAILFILVIAIRRYFERKSAITAKEELKQDLDSRRLITVQSLLLTISNLAMIAHLINPSLMAWSTINLPIWLGWLGVVLGIPVIGLLIWTHITLDKNFFGGVKLRQGHQLITDGPYRRVRHPMYTAFLSIGLCWFLLSGNLIVSGFWLAGTLLVIATRLYEEEQMMLEEFGDAYRIYMQATGRFFPRV